MEDNLMEDNLTTNNANYNTLPGQERYVAPLDDTPLQEVDSVDESAPATSMWADAWRSLRRNPLFIVSAILIIAIIFCCALPRRSYKAQS